MTTNNAKHQLNQTKHKPRVAVGMSGGVDSSLSAHLLVEQGYDVTGVYLECWRAPGCRTEEDRQDALRVALSLDLPFQILDFKDAYKNKVVENFFNDYEAGLTPNPDVMCNKEIKFGLFYDWAMAEGFDYIATGHYAKTRKIDDRDQLIIPADQHKDQTYFMYLMTEEQVSHTLFPLQDMTKKEVRAEAEKRGIHTAGKKDSVGICFIGDINVHDFLKERLGENPGDVVDSAGNVIGQHQGLWFYTTGQRSGFTVNQTSIVENSDGSQVTKHNIPPFYVIAKNADKNQLVVGFGSETFRQDFEISNIHWISEGNQELASKGETFVRIRHTGELFPCQVSINSENNEASIILAEPAKGIAEGQSAVLYSSDNICLGGGVISL